MNNMHMTGVASLHVVCPKKAMPLAIQITLSQFFQGFNSWGVTSQLSSFHGARVKAGLRSVNFIVPCPFNLPAVELLQTRMHTDMHQSCQAFGPDIEPGSTSRNAIASYRMGAARDNTLKETILILQDLSLIGTLPCACLPKEAEAR